MRATIGVIGAGYLGATHAACLAELGFRVVVADCDASKVEALNRGAATFFEPELAELLRGHTSSGRLRATTSVADLAIRADVHFICVGTPQGHDGGAADTSQVFGSVEALVPHLTRPALLVGKSTVPVGTAARLQETVDLLAPGLRIEVAWNPEFLREGQAVADTLSPDRLVFGVTSAEAEKTLRVVYDGLLARGTPLVVTDLATAELVKVAANAFLATKISFANVMAELCEAAGGDVVTLVDALGHDVRIGQQFLTAGLGFGGGCLPKDLRALIARAGELGVDEALNFFGEVDSINVRRRERMVDLAVEELGGSVAGRRIAVLGAAFKPLTDDVRDSPALDVAQQLQQRGAVVVVHDPRANANAAALFPALTYAASAAEAVTGAHLVLHLTEWAEFAMLDPAQLSSVACELRIIDGRNILDGNRWRQAGWRFRSMGRAVQPLT